MQVSWFSFIFLFWGETRKTRALTTVASYNPTLRLSSGYHKYFLLLFPGQVSINFFFLSFPFTPTLFFSSVISPLSLSSRVDVIASGNARMRPAAATASLREKKRARRLRIEEGREEKWSDFRLFGSKKSVFLAANRLRVEIGREK